MLKKLITIGLLTLIIVLTMPMAHGQRAIDPLLKPDNAPSVPLTGPAKLGCLQEHSKDPKNTDIKTLYEAVKKDNKKLNSLTDSEKETLAKIWDDNSQMCQGHAEEPITAFIQILAGALLMIAGGIAVIVIAIGGVMYLTSGGRQNQMDFAKNTLMYGIIGMLIMIFSYYIIQFVIKLIIGG